MSLEQAIAVPRIHHQWMPDEVRVERSALSDDLRARLEAMRHRFAAKVGGAGEVWGNALEPGSSKRIGVTDPRSPDAGAVGY